MHSVEHTRKCTVNRPGGPEGGRNTLRSYFQRGKINNKRPIAPGGVYSRTCAVPNGKRYGARSTISRTCDPSVLKSRVASVGRRRGTASLSAQPSQFGVRLDGTKFKRHGRLGVRGIPAVLRPAAAAHPSAGQMLHVSSAITSAITCKLHGQVCPRSRCPGWPTISLHATTCRASRGSSRRRLPLQSHSGRPFQKKTLQRQQSSPRRNSH